MLKLLLLLWNCPYTITDSIDVKSINKQESSYFLLAILQRYKYNYYRLLSILLIYINTNINLRGYLINR